jgi:hypothetical protein
MKVGGGGSIFKRGHFQRVDTEAQPQVALPTMAKVRSSRKVGNSTQKAAKEKRGRRGVASKPKVTKGRRSSVPGRPLKKQGPAPDRVPTVAQAQVVHAAPVVEVPQTPPPLPAPIASFVF